MHSVSAKIAALVAGILLTIPIVSCSIFTDQITTHGISNSTNTNSLTTSPSISPRPILPNPIPVNNPNLANPSITTISLDQFNMYQEANVLAVRSSPVFVSYPGSCSPLTNVAGRSQNFVISANGVNGSVVLSDCFQNSQNTYGTSYLCPFKLALSCYNLVPSSFSSRVYLKSSTIGFTRPFQQNTGLQPIVITSPTYYAQAHYASSALTYGFYKDCSPEIPGHSNSNMNCAEPTGWVAELICCTMDPSYSRVVGAASSASLSFAEQADQAAVLDSLNGGALESATELGNDLLTIANHESRNGPIRALESFKNSPSTSIDQHSKTKSGFILQSYRNIVRSVANSTRAIKDKESLFAVYRGLYQTVIRLRLGGALPKPEDLVNSSIEDIEINIHTANSLILENSSSAVKGGNVQTISGVLRSATSNVNQTLACDGSDYGAGTGADAYYRILNAPAQNGIFSKTNFPLKPYLTCIKNQGARGTCTAFSIVAGMEMAVMQKYNLKINLSEQALYFQGKGVLDTAQEDQNTDEYNDFEYLNYSKNSGYRVPFENYWNYNPNYFLGACDNNIYNGRKNIEYCSYTPSQGMPVSAYQKDGVQLFGLLSQITNPNLGVKITRDNGFLNIPVLNLNNLSDFQFFVGALAASPVVFAVTMVNDSLISSNGFFPDPGSFQYPLPVGTYSGGHAMLAIGFVSNQTVFNFLGSSAPAYAQNNKSSPYNGYFIVKNSWGIGFGDGGIIYIPDSYIKNNIYWAYAITGIDLAR